jgi:magnesium transporter
VNPVIWHDIRDPESPELDELAQRYHLHPLHIEDCRHRNQIAKVEAQNGYLFVVLKPVDLEDDYSLTVGDIDFFIAPEFIITVQETKCQSLTRTLDHVHRLTSPVRSDQLFHRIADAVVDSYYPILDRLSDRIDELEDEALSHPEPKLLEQVFCIKRALIEFRRVMSNTRDVVGHMLREQYPIIQRDLMPFIRDVYDHTVRALDMIEVHRDLVTGTTELYLSSVANRTNQVMKALTIFGAVATPALVITGMYGMNLKHLPFAEHPHSWGIVITLITVVCVALLAFLKKFRWL